MCCTFCHATGLAGDILESIGFLVGSCLWHPSLSGLMEPMASETDWLHLYLFWGCVSTTRKRY